MGRLVGRIRALALALGAPGLFLVALLDSTFLPLPGATDLLLIVMVARHNDLVAWYILAAIAGSMEPRRHGYYWYEGRCWLRRGDGSYIRVSRDRCY